MADPIDLEALAVWLENFNEWRRGRGNREMPHPVEIGKKLDEAARAVRMTALLTDDLRKAIDAGPPDRICEQCSAPMFDAEGWTDPDGVSGCLPMMTEGKQQGPCFSYRCLASPHRSEAAHA